ncbi:CD63 antigen-like [Aricia agestis]|uniref:CD63 antigen-like n=1 Tax=Aricia agestis TaxID=91739 RepID=UPI001C207AEC|nr:CD63 antigen-like [Aricia agestis]
MSVPNTNKMKFLKTELEYNMKSIRFLLLTITAMFIVIAGLMIVLGFSVYGHFHNFSFFFESAKSGRFFTPSVLSIILGMVLLIVTLVGFFGSLKQSTCMVNLYAFLLSIILLLKLIVVILAFALDAQTLYSYVSVPVWDYTTDPEIQAEIDQLQRCLSCCGSDSYLDYVGMEFTANQSTVVVSTQVDGDHVTVVVPESCCMTVGEVYCNKMRAVGCKSAVISLVVQNASVIGVLGVSVMFIQLLGIIFALLLARCIRKLKSQRGLMAWTIKEQMVMAREAAKAKTPDDKVYIAPTESSTA